MLCNFHPTLQQHSHQRRAIAILGLLHQQLSVIQDMSDGVAPLDDAVHDVASIIFLVCAESLHEKQELILTGGGRVLAVLSRRCEMSGYEQALCRC